MCTVSYTVGHVQTEHYYHCCGDGGGDGGGGDKLNLMLVLSITVTSYTHAACTYR
jgi:hypothetical protein